MTCGSGSKQRSIICIDTLTGNKVAERNCRQGDQPKTRRRCRDNPCPFRWISADWSKVSPALSQGPFIKGAKGAFTRTQRQQGPTLCAREKEKGDHLPESMEMVSYCSNQQVAPVGPDGPELRIPFS